MPPDDPFDNLSFAEELQAERPAAFDYHGAHARLRLLSAAVGLSGVALILVLLFTGAPTNG